MKQTAYGALKRFFAVFLVLVITFQSVTMAYATSLSTIAVDTIGAIAAAEISCHKDQISSGISGIFGGNSSSGSTMGTGASGSNSIPINVVQDSETAEKIANASATTANDITCTKAVEKAAAQVILRQLTVATVNWINRGFKGGSSFFPKDEKSFLKAIGDQATEKFVGNIAFDAKNYPFGRNVAQGIVSNMSRTFEQRAQYSLDRVLAQQYNTYSRPPTVADFERSFLEGGWVAFDHQFQTGNNPIGFQMGAQNEIAARKQGTYYNPAYDIRDQLMRNAGFLDTKICVAPSTYNDSSDKTAAEARAKMRALPDDPSSEKEAARLREVVFNNTCTQYATQTPGSVVAASLNKVLGSPIDQLGLGQDLTADLTAIFNALTNQLMQRGLAALATTDASSAPSQYTNNGSFVNPSIDVVGGVDPNTNGSWLNSNRTFNVFKDIPLIIPNEDYTPKNALDPKPRGYQQALEEQNQQAARLITAVYKLDFCVPGPHPGWRQDAVENLREFTSSSDNIPANADAAISQGSLIVNKILDPINFLNLKNATSDKRNEKFFAGVVSHFLSYTPAQPSDDYYFPNKQQNPPPTTHVTVEDNLKVNGHNSIVNIFNTLFNRYADIVDQTYLPEYNPDITLNLPLEYTINETKFRNVSAYKKALHDNKILITSSKATVEQLNSLVARINKLPTFAGYIDHTQTTTTTLFTNTTIAPQQLGIATLTTGTGTVITPPTPTAPVIPHDKWYWYQQDFLETQGKSIAILTPYQVELRRISSTFDLIAPKIHSLDDVNKQEDALVALKNELSDYEGKGGYIETCVTDTNGAAYSAPKARMFYPRTILEEIPVMAPSAGYGAYDGRAEFIAFEDTFTDVGYSMLPDVHYAMGQGADQVPHFEAKFGKQTEKNVVKNDDVVTINDQPLKYALAGLEAIINIY